MGNEAGKELLDKLPSLSDTDNKESGQGSSDTKNKSPPLSPLSIIKDSPLGNLPFFNKTPPPSPVLPNKPILPAHDSFDNISYSDHLECSTSSGQVHSTGTELALRPNTSNEEGFHKETLDDQKFLEAALTESSGSVMPESSVCDVQTDVKLSVTVQQKISRTASLLTEYSLEIRNESTDVMKDRKAVLPGDSVTMETESVVKEIESSCSEAASISAQLEDGMLLSEAVGEIIQSKDNFEETNSQSHTVSGQVAVVGQPENDVEGIEIPSNNNNKSMDLCIVESWEDKLKENMVKHMTAQKSVSNDCDSEQSEILSNVQEVEVEPKSEGSVDFDVHDSDVEEYSGQENKPKDDDSESDHGTVSIATQMTKVTDSVDSGVHCGHSNAIEDRASHQDLNSDDSEPEIHESTSTSTEDVAHLSHQEESANQETMSSHVTEPANEISCEVSSESNTMSSTELTNQEPSDIDELSNQSSVDKDTADLLTKTEQDSDSELSDNMPIVDAPEFGDDMFSLSDIEDAFQQSNLSMADSVLVTDGHQLESSKVAVCHQSETVSGFVSDQSSVSNTDQSLTVPEHADVDQSETGSSEDQSHVFADSSVNQSESSNQTQKDQSVSSSQCDSDESSIADAEPTSHEEDQLESIPTSPIPSATRSQAINGEPNQQENLQSTSQTETSQPETSDTRADSVTTSVAGEDRIDRIYSLLNKYKEYQAKLQAVEVSGDPAVTVTGDKLSPTPRCPCGHSDTDSDSDCDTRTAGRNHVHAKLDRSWEDETDLNFPKETFELLQDEAEHRIAARRAARQEARDIRMREIERQQREAEEKEREGNFKSTPTTISKTSHTPRYANTRQDSDEASSADIRALKKDLCEMDDKYTKAMMDNAQLDNEKQTLRYEVDLLKDRLEDLSEEHIELQRENKDKCRELEQKKRLNTDLSHEVAYLKQQLQQRDQLIEEYGLVFISDETLGDDIDKDRQRQASTNPGTTALVTPQAADILRKQGEGTLDNRLVQFEQEKKALEEEIKKLKQQVDQEKERSALAEKYSTPRLSQVSNGPDVNEIQMESQRTINEYKFKLKKAQQDITTLEGNVIRLESQAKRYKQSADNAEKNEEELKQEKRKLQRELREAQILSEELETSNQHLTKRMEKMKSARNAILNS